MGVTTGGYECVSAPVVVAFVRRLESEVSEVIAARAGVRVRLLRLRVVLLALHVGTEPLEPNLIAATAILAEPLPPSSGD